MMEEKRFQVFVSSTYSDLVEARAKVIETILNLYHFPVGMEMFSADDAEQWEVIKDTIRISDYYVVIIGHRYGSETATGTSYTEKEYDYARSQDVPVLAFIRDRNAPTQPHERDDDPEKIRKLQEFVDSEGQSPILINFLTIVDMGFDCRSCQGVRAQAVQPHVPPHVASSSDRRQGSPRKSNGRVRYS